MKISKTWIALAVAVASSNTLCAQNPVPAATQNSAAQNLHKLDSTTTGPGIRASTLMGM